MRHSANPSAITYTKGDATAPQGTGRKIIAHVCNDVGGWGAGFVLAISRRWKQPEQQYRKWYAERESNDFDVGAVQFVGVEHELWVANMVAQTGLRLTKSGPPIRYEALVVCLEHVASKALEIGASVHMPRIGCGLAGGKWSEVEPLIVEHVSRRGVAVTVYDFTPSEKERIETGCYEVR
jgi:O-acetyl-ADP-ribose deacetylase (regulator of RNase III)